MQQLTLPAITPAYRLKIEHDCDPQSPREWDNLGTMVCWHRNYYLGDEQPSEDPQEYRLCLAERCKPGFEERLELELERMTRKIPAQYGTQAYRDAAREINAYSDACIDAVLDKHYISLPLYLYDHGGITMSTGSFACPWDSGQVGFIYVSIAKVKAEYGWKVLTAKRRKQIEQYLRNEVQTYDHYLTNNVYGFTVEQWDGAGWGNEHSCWGFFGDDVNESGMMCYLDRDFTLEQVREAHRYDKRGEWVYNTTEAAECGINPRPCAFPAQGKH